MLLNLLISDAYAQAAPAAGGEPNILMQMGPFLLMIGVLYFLMIRPQMKKAKEHKTLVDALQKGDEVLTHAGIAGRITKVGENYIGLEVAANVEIAVQKNAVAAVLPKGTLKTL